ncbi:MAG: DUF362 domain-containing protein [Candidatus Aminicenantes bacterium]|nr:DUF362 domain-containing protein [Candidatus Aminicenantes bacterium]
MKNKRKKPEEWLISTPDKGWSRRDFLRLLAGGIFSPFAISQDWTRLQPSKILNDLYWIKDIPNEPFYNPLNPNLHLGLDSLLYLMAESGLKFYRSQKEHFLAGPQGLIASDDVVLIKVNAQWKYRGCTNSDLVRGLIQRILDHPDGFTGEVVIFENGQGRGSLACDTSAAYGDSSIQANANNKEHSFLYLVHNIFNDPRVSSFLLDSFSGIFIGPNDHTTNGYRRYEDVSYPCFTTARGHRIELREGLWRGNGYSRNLKLINVPVLKHHDVGGSEITASLKHFYGILSMSDGYSGYRHYSGLGETCGKMVASIITPVLNIIDAIWVSHGSLTGYPPDTTFRANQLLASQDPVALDYWAAKYILYPIDYNYRHHPDFPGINKWLVAARDMINSRGGLSKIDQGIIIDRVTNNENEMRVFSSKANDFLHQVKICLSKTELSFVFSATSRLNEKVKEVSLSFTENLPLFWWAETNHDWLEVKPMSGHGNTRLIIQVNMAGLDPGLYSGQILFHCPQAANSPVSLHVRLIKMGTG